MQCQTIAPSSSPQACGKCFNMASQLSASPLQLHPGSGFPSNPEVPPELWTTVLQSAQHLQSAARHTAHVSAHREMSPSIRSVCPASQACSLPRSPYLAEVQHLPCWPCLHSARSPWSLSLLFFLFH